MTRYLVSHSDKKAVLVVISEVSKWVTVFAPRRGDEVPVSALVFLQGIVPVKTRLHIGSLGWFTIHTHRFSMRCPCGYTDVPFFSYALAVRAVWVPVMLSLSHLSGFCLLFVQFAFFCILPELDNSRCVNNWIFRLVSAQGDRGVPLARGPVGPGLVLLRGSWIFWKRLRFDGPAHHARAGHSRCSSGETSDSF